MGIAYLHIQEKIYYYLSSFSKLLSWTEAIFKNPDNEWIGNLRPAQYGDF